MQNDFYQYFFIYSSSLQTKKDINLLVIFGPEYLVDLLRLYLLDVFHHVLVSRIILYTGHRT